MPHNSYLSPSQLSARWGKSVTPGTLANWRVKRKGSPFVKLESRVLYRLSDVVAWEAENLAPGFAAAA